MTHTEAPASVHAAIIAIMGEVGYVQKQRTQGLNYSYASEAALIAALRPAMIEHGVYVSVFDVVETIRDTYETKNGASMNSTFTGAKVRFTHAPSDTHIDVYAQGEGADIGDKSSNKAMTGLLKYALRQTFLIETGDDPDATPSDAQERVPAAEQPAHDPEARPSSKADILARVRHHVDAGKKASDNQRGLMVGMIEECFGGSGNEEAKRKSVTMYLFARESSKDLTDAQVLALLDWLDVQKDSGGAYYPCAEASQEAVKIVIAQMKKMGQEAMEL